MGSNVRRGGRHTIKSSFGAQGKSQNLAKAQISDQAVVHTNQSEIVRVCVLLAV